MTPPRATPRLAGLAALLIAGTVQTQAAAAPPTDGPEDYTDLLPLSVSGKEAIVRFRLPPPVYLRAQSADLRDLRLFDARGQQVVFALHQDDDPARDAQRMLPTTIFPVAQAARAGAADTTLDIRTAPDGSLLSVHARGAGKASTPAALGSLILALRLPVGAAAPTLDALHFAPPAGLRNYSAHVAIDVSDDLQHWRALTDASLDWLVNADGLALAKDSIDFAPQSFRYARLRWLDGTPRAFASVQAAAPEHDSPAPALDSIVLAARPGRQERDLEYDSAIALPVQRIGLQFSEQNVTLPVLLGQYQEVPGRRAGARAGWRFAPSLRTTFYQFVQSGRQRASDDIALAPSHVARWVLRPLVDTSSRPGLRLSWAPATLVFMDDGHAPYRLAFGRAGADSVRRDLAEVAPGIGAKEMSSL